jgi:hypothetical protein
MWTKEFWIQVAERAIKTFAQVMLGFLVVGQSGVLNVDWANTLSVATVAAFASVLMSLVGEGIGDKGTPSVVKVVKVDTTD